MICTKENTKPSYFVYKVFSYFLLLSGSLFLFNDILKFKLAPPIHSNINVYKQNKTNK